MITFARTTSPPKACPSDWWPRHTPNTGMRGPSVFITSTDTPASFGVHGPGEMTIRSGFSASICATVSSSLRTTRTSSPSSCRYCTRLKVKLS